MTISSSLPLLPAAPHHEDAERLFAALVRQTATPCPARAMTGSGDVCLALQSLITALKAGARRPIRLSPCGAHEVSADERALANLVAAIQIGREEEARLRADWLVRRPYRDSLFAAAARLADALANEWIYLPVPTAAATTRSPRGKPTLAAAPSEADASANGRDRDKLTRAIISKK